MTTYARFVSLSSRTVGEQLFQELLRICPEGRSGKTFACKLAESDPRTGTIINLLASEGFEPWSGFTKPSPREYWLEMQREYDEADWEAAELLEPRPRQIVDGLIKEWPAPAKLVRGKIPTNARVV